MKHTAVLEGTNGGACFAECTCGWSGGVRPDRSAARAAHRAHVEGRDPGEPIRPTVLPGPYR